MSNSDPHEPRTGERQNSPEKLRPWVWIHIAPTVILLITYIIVLYSKTDWPLHKSAAMVLTISLSIPVAFLVSFLSMKSRRIQNRLHFLLAASLIGISWAVLISFAFLLVGLFMWCFIGFGNGPLPIDKDLVPFLLKDFFTKIPTLCILFLPLHFISAIIIGNTKPASSSA